MRIITESYICRKGAFLNGKKIIDTNHESDNYLKELYQGLQLNYPKFFKMDNLSKMVLLGSKLLMGNLEELGDGSKLQLTFANSGSSQKTDLQFKKGYVEMKSASPSLFVYTLPNILIGELSIYFGWYGENVFVIQEEFAPQFFIDQAEFAFKRGNSHCLCGWVEAKTNSEEECYLFLMKNEGEALNCQILLNSLISYRNE